MEKEKINKKPIIALIILGIVLGIGGTVAYFTSSVDLINTFRTQTFKTVTTETFVSPSDWTPGTTTDKTLVVKNEGNVDVAVRVSFTQSWKSSTNSNLPLTFGSGESAAIINYANTSMWIHEGDYYYYKNKLSSGDTTQTFISGVKFNENAPSSIACTTTQNGNETIKTCQSDGSGYDGATYELKITVETIQYNAYNEAWGTTVNIS